jgi:hypothetical protein
MSQEVIVISDWQNIDLMKYFPFVKETATSYLFAKDVNFLNCIIDDIRSLYDEAPLAFIESYFLGQEFRFLIVDTTSFDLLNKFISQLPIDHDLLIENDHGVFVNREQFLKIRNFSELKEIDMNTAIFSYTPNQENNEEEIA